MFLVLLLICVGVELLNLVVTPCFNYPMNDCQAVFHSCLTIVTFPSTQYKCSNACTSLPPLVCHYGLSHPSGCEVVFICVSLMTNDVEHSSVHFLATAYYYVLWRYVYSDPLPFKKLDYLCLLLSGKNSLYIWGVSPLSDK